MKASNDVPLDDLVFWALSARGEVLPETTGEVMNAEKHLEQHPVEVPESLKDVRKLLERIKAGKVQPGSKVIQLPPHVFASIAEEMACAARNGTEITRDIQELMRKNRAKTLRELGDKPDPE